MTLRRASMPTLLNLAVVVVLLAMLGFQAWVVVSAHRQALAVISTRAANRAQANGQQLDAILAATDVLLQGVRDGLDPDEIRAGPDARTGKRAKAMRGLLQRAAARVPQVELLHVIGPDGHFVYSSSPSLPTVSVADRANFQAQQAATRDRLGISEPYVGRVTGRWGLILSRRLTGRDGRFAGVVQASLDSERLGAAMVAVDLQQWTLALYDPEHHLVARVPPGNRPIGTHEPTLGPEGGFPGAGPGAPGPHVWIGPGLGETAPHLWAGQQLRTQPFVTVAGYGRDQALAAWRADLRVHVAAALLLALGGLGLARLLRRNTASVNAIRSLHERLSLATRGGGLGIWDWDVAADRLFWDDTMYQLFGTDRADPRGAERIWREAQSDEGTGADLRAALAGAGEFHAQWRILWPDGSLHHLAILARILRDTSGRPLRLVGTCQDITEAERGRELLASSEAYFRTLFDAVPDAVAVVWADQVVDANQRYRQMFQLSAEAGAPPWELAPPRQADGAHTRDKGHRLAVAALRGGMQRLPWQCQRTDGSVFDCELAVTLFPHEGRDLLITIVRDLTEIRRIQEELRQAHKLDALGQLAGGVAHDFNNMLSAIRVSADLLKETGEGRGNEQRHKAACLIATAAERAAQLTRQLLAFARSGKILSTATDMHQILREAVALLERTIDRRIRIELRLEAAHATVIGDPAQLQNALLNLGVNARDAMPDGGQITFTSGTVRLDGEACRLGSFLMDPGDYLHIAVADDGCGISEANLQRIFDPFFTTKDVDKGTGLGLSALFGTMVSHHGAVTVTSRLGQGSTFHLYLPLATGVPEEASRGGGPVATGRARLLVIDDEDLVRSATTLVLESMGHTVLAEGDPERGIAHFRANHGELDAVLLDLIMPRMSGAQAAGILRAIDPAVPILLISGFPRNAEITELLRGGVAGFLQKPLNRQDLAEALAGVLAGRRNLPRPGA